MDISIKYNIVERLYADGDRIAFGQTAQRLQQCVSALVEVAQERWGRRIL